MNQRVHNFSAGPSKLPEAVLSQIQQECFNWRQTGVSIMEISHRHPKVVEMIRETEVAIRELLNIPDTYHVLFCHGGGRAQYSLIPLNFLNSHDVADYAITGLWSVLAAKEANRFASINIPVNTETQSFRTIPPIETWDLHPEARYLHYVDNETIHGVEFPAAPQVKGVPLVSDMTSNIMSKPLDITQYGMIYAACQKNLGIAGLTVVILDPNLIPNDSDPLPVLHDYKTYIEHRSLYNTPPVFPIYVTSKLVQWLKKQGGVEAIFEMNQHKAQKLYDFIDNSEFYENRVVPEVRSRMNVSILLKKQDLIPQFIKEAEAQGLFGLQGHRYLGGIRASLYNAVTEEAVDHLIHFMKTFAWRYQHS